MVKLILELTSIFFSLAVQGHLIYISYSTCFHRMMAPKVTKVKRARLVLLLRSPRLNSSCLLGPWHHLCSLHLLYTPISGSISSTSSLFSCYQSSDLWPLLFFQLWLCVKLKKTVRTQTARYCWSNCHINSKPEKQEASVLNHVITM